MALSGNERTGLLALIRQRNGADLYKLLADMLGGLVSGSLTTPGTATVGGLVMANSAVTAGAAGTDIPADAAFVTITSAGANNWVNLPAPVIGKVLFLSVGANGCEVRTSAPASIAINGGSGANAESALPANTFAMLVCKSATEWVGWDLTGTTFAAIEAAA